MSPGFSDNVLPFWSAKRRSGQQVCLVTLVKIEGSAPRPLGSQLAVSADGDSLGYITGGCAEAALVAEALNVIASGTPRLIRLGQGSPYKDISLPCGSGIDVYLHPAIDCALIEAVIDSLEIRQANQLNFDLDSGEVSRSRVDVQLPRLESRKKAGKEVGKFGRPYAPPMALRVAGKGPIVSALATLAFEVGFEVYAASPEAATLDTISSPDIRKHTLAMATDFELSNIDRWTTIVTLFHDHEWEPPILAQALKSEAFYIGALGSRRTHKARVSELEAMGISAANIDKIHGPVGLDIQASTPPEIALSILADIIQTYRISERGPLRW